MGDQFDEFETKMTKKKKRNGNNNKRRFSEEQVRWLESMFKTESKLEPRQKAEVATQLGLQPRQVAIWFQNKRARWKSRQLQHDFDALRRDYDALSSRFHLLERQNLSLSLQLQELKELTGNSHEQSYKAEEVANDRVSESNKREQKKPGDSEHLYMASGADEVVAAAVEPTCSSLTSSDEEWHGLPSHGLFHQSPRSCHWWDFWP